MLSSSGSKFSRKSYLEQSFPGPINGQRVDQADVDAGDATTTEVEQVSFHFGF